MEIEKIQSVVKKGSWVYDKTVSKEIRILKQNWDYYYEGEYSEGEAHLNEDGFSFYVVFGEPLGDGTYSSRSETLYSLDEAIKYANEKVSGGVVWE
jgi:hypothetical protein